MIIISIIYFSVWTTCRCVVSGRGWGQFWVFYQLTPTKADNRNSGVVKPQYKEWPNPKLLFVVKYLESLDPLHPVHPQIQHLERGCKLGYDMIRLRSCFGGHLIRRENKLGVSLTLWQLSLCLKRGSSS